MTGLTLQTRIRDAELSVRTANGLCSMYGEDVKFEHFVDPGPDELEMFRVIGRKGLKEFREVLGYARDGSRALSKPPPIVEDSDYDGPKGETKTLRDEFAMIADRNEFGELKYSHISRTLAEQLLGRPYPNGEGVGVQLERVKWDIELSAKLRFMFADAMMEARS